MTQKRLILAVLIIIIIALGLFVFELNLKKPASLTVVPQPSPNPPVATTTTEPTPAPAPVTPPPPAGPQVICYSSKQPISTSTWKTFNNPEWPLTFRYPAGWTSESLDPYNQMFTGDGVQFSIKKAGEVGAGLLPDSFEESYHCSHLVAGNNADIGAYLFYLSSPTLTRAFSLQYTPHDYIYFYLDITPSSTAPINDPIFYEVLDTMRFK